MIKTIHYRIKGFFNKITNFVSIVHVFKLYNDYTVVWLYPHIGDLFYTLPFISFYKKKYDKKIVIIGNSKYISLYNLFNGIDDYYLLSEEKCWRFLSYNNFRFTVNLLKTKVKNKQFITNDLGLLNDFFPVADYDSLVEYTRQNVFGLSNNIALSFPKYHRGKRLSKNRYIIICPYAQSTEKLNFKLFDTFIHSLKQMGYDVYSNISGEEKEIINTIALKCSLEDLCLYSFYADFIITLRSGISDMLSALTETTLFVLFNNFRLGKIATVKPYREDCNNIFEYYDKTDKNIIDEILCKIKQQSRRHNSD